MKRSKSVRLVAMGTGLFLVAACDEAKVDTAVFETAKQCQELGFTADECRANYERARTMHTEVAPKYTSKEACESDFGAAQCETAPQQTASGGSVFMPLMMGYMMGSMLSGNRGATTQPLYRSRDDRSTFRTADNKSVGSNVGRVQVASSAATAPTTKTRTVSRGGFGANARSTVAG